MPGRTNLRSPETGSVWGGAPAPVKVRLRCSPISCEVGAAFTGAIHVAETCPRCGTELPGGAKHDAHPHRLDARAEAERLVRVFNGQVPQLMQLLSGQFGVL